MHQYVLHKLLPLVAQNRVRSGIRGAVRRLRIALEALASALNLRGKENILARCGYGLQVQPYTASGDLFSHAIRRVDVAKADRRRNVNLADQRNFRGRPLCKLKALRAQSRGQCGAASVTSYLRLAPCDVRSHESH